MLYPKKLRGKGLFFEYRDFKPSILIRQKVSNVLKRKAEKTFPRD